MSFWNLFENKKKKIDSLKALYDRGVITKEKLYSEVYFIDPNAVNEVLSPVDREIFDLTGKFNRNEITIVQYKEQIKNLDIAKWLTLANEDELARHELEEDFRNRKISDSEYRKGMANLDKEIYIDISNIEFDVEGNGKHAISLDWNYLFIEELKSNGYTGATDEEIVDKWFVSLCTTIAAESETVIVMDPEDTRKVKYDQTKAKTEHY